MEYREFVCAAIETMNQKEGKNGIQAREHRAVKNNGKIRVGLLLQETGSNLFPTIYLEEYYEKFQKGETLEQIVSEISQLYQKIKAKNIIDVDSFFNLESWKNKLGIKVIKTEKNRELLEEIPHLDVLDLSLTFYVILDRQCEGSATMQITNEYMRQWNLETEELYEMAMRSAVRLLPAEFCSLPDMIRRITGIEVEAIRGMQRECQMYVLTNSSKIQGAACMFYPHVLEMIGEILKEDFYILPSSIHEVIILPKSREIAKEELDAMVRVGDLIDTIEYDYPAFHLSMDCFWCEVASGELKLLEAEAARWLTKEELDSVQWLPADVTLIDKIKSCMS